MKDDCRNETRCRALSVTCDYLSLHDDGATGPSLMVHAALTGMLRLLVFASSLAAFAVGTFLYIRFVRRLI